MGFTCGQGRRDESIKGVCKGMCNNGIQPLGVGNKLHFGATEGGDDHGKASGLRGLEAEELLGEQQSRDEEEVST